MRRALLIACGQYDDNEFTDLKFPLRDAERLGAVLDDKSLCGFDSVVTLANPTKAQVHRSIEELATSGNRDDLLLLYFSGHGKQLRDGSLALVLRDTENGYLHSSGLPDDSIRRLFNDSRASQKVIVLDCCYSGAAGAEGFKGSASDVLDATARIPGTFLLTASTEFQVAFECSDLEGSALTACLVEGILSGKAAREGSEQVTLADLGSYVAREVPQRSSQQPRYWDHGGIGGTAFAQVPRQFDDKWREQARRKLKQLWRDDKIDDELLDEARLHLHKSAGARPEILQLIDQLVTDAISPLKFQRDLARLGADEPEPPSPPPPPPPPPPGPPPPKGSEAESPAGEPDLETLGKVIAWGVFAVFVLGIIATLMNANDDSYAYNNTAFSNSYDSYDVTNAADDYYASNAAAPADANAAAPMANDASYYEPASNTVYYGNAM